MKNQLLVCFILLATVSRLSAQESYPHILVHDGEKMAIMEKVVTKDWAKSIYTEMVEKVQPYVDRHQTDREWILSRYLMNRVPGKRYTTVYSDDEGKRLVKWEGDAPVPTVRVNTYLRSPITKNGTSYRKPTIEELVPNDTARLMYLYNPETKLKEWVDPEAYITSINGDINELAQSAAIIYWLTGEEKYATFAADILQQWAQGAYYQEPIVGPCRTGFLDMQTLGDASYRSLIVAYDFVKPFMKRKGYDLHYYETVFEKIASTLAFRGFWNNNWYAAESSTMVFAALSLEDVAKRDYYLQYFLEKDTINGSCGQLALPSTVERWLTHDGHWKEPGGYHNYPVSNLLIASLALEKNGYSVFKRFPELFRASFAMMKYAFPNLSVSAFGDTGHATPSGVSLEIGLIGAVKYGERELDEMAASMQKLIDAGKYRRESAGFLGLLCYLPEIPKATSTFEWPRSGTLEFARYFLQRNGDDPKRGLMVGVQGATYNHNHCNGMAMELYGLGGIMGIDAGTGANYEHPTHRNYYSQWSAHNTVVAAGSSSSIPFSGAAGTKRIGQIELVAMEPMADVRAISESYSFTETSYFDASTKTNQLRLLAIVRTSPSTGYYVDIYRSDNKIANDYVYHNVGDGLTLLDRNREALATVTTDYPLIGNDYPGFRFYTDVEKLENYRDNVTALFTVKREGETDKFMQVLMPKEKGRTYYRAFSPKAKTADFHDVTKPQPVMTVRTKKEAWSRPFIAVFEPFEGEGNQSVREVVKMEKLCNKHNTVLKVVNWDNSSQIILQGNDCSKGVSGEGLVFTGYYGVVSLKEGLLEKIYLGKGKEIGYENVLLSCVNEGGSAVNDSTVGGSAENGSAVNATAVSNSAVGGSAEICFLGKNQMLINCNTTIQLSISGSAMDGLIDKNLSILGLRIEKTKKGVKLTIPASTDLVLKW